jgi:TolB-like protein
MLYLCNVKKQSAFRVIVDLIGIFMITFNQSKVIVARNLLLLASLTITSGCSSFDDKEKQNEIFRIEEKIIQVPIEDEIYSFHTHKKIDDYTDKLAHDLMIKLKNRVIDTPVVITSFVYFDDTLQRTDKVGNLISESMIGQIQDYGLPVMDLHLMGGINITNRGSFAFSRDVSEILYAESIEYVLSGVMIKNERGIQVNARIIEVKSKKVISNATNFIPFFVIEAI